MPISALAFAPKGNLLAAVAADGVIKVWKVSRRGLTKIGTNRHALERFDLIGIQREGGSDGKVDSD